MMSTMLYNMLNKRLDKTTEALTAALGQVAQLRKHPSDMLHGCMLIDTCTRAQKFAHMAHAIVSRIDCEAYNKRKAAK